MKNFFTSVLTFFVALSSLVTANTDNARLRRKTGMPEAPDGKLTVMSFNIQHCRNYLEDRIDYDLFAETIKESGADIIGLNEVWGKGLGMKSQAKILAEKLGYYYCFGRAIFTNGTTEYGNALLSRYPIKTVEKIKIPDPEPKAGTGSYETRGIIKAEIDVAGKTFTVLVTHFGLNPDEQENAVAAVCGAIGNRNCILMGDFNVRPDNEVLKPIYEKLCDTSEAFEEELYSFPSDRPNRRIDYMFASSDLNVVSADIPDLVVSDHRPYICEFEYTARTPNMDYTAAGSYLSQETTENQPFPRGVCGCNEFRIPGIITLQSGKLFATGDARWDDAEHDYGGIDTIFSVSGDGGKTWHPGFAAMFPDSVGTPKNPHDVTTCIDPCVVQDKNGTVHVFVNMNPTGITTGLGWPGKGNGYVEADGKNRLALTTDFTEAGSDFYTGKDVYYVGDYSEGFAPVFGPDGEETGYTVDGYFNIYKDSEPLYQKQIDTGRDIQQNIFYRDSAFHVFNTMLTLHLSTGDEGKTWTTEIISDSIKLPDEDALISSPGNGTVTPSGTLLMPFYTFDDTVYIGFPLVVYSDDCGKTWNRTPVLPPTDDIKYSGESKIVALSDTLWRVFIRNQNNRICYVDFDRETNTWSKPVKTDVKVHSDCNLGAIAYKDRIYVSCPAGRGTECKDRCNGRVYVFSLDKNNGLCLEKKIKVTDKAFSYSCLAVCGGRLCVLYDTCGDGELILKTFPID